MSNKCKALQFIEDTKQSLESIINFIIKNDGNQPSRDIIEADVLHTLNMFDRPINLWRHNWKRNNRTHIDIEHKLREIVMRITWAKTKHIKPIDAFENKDTLVYVCTRLIHTENDTG